VPLLYHFSPAGLFLANWLPRPSRTASRYLERAQVIQTVLTLLDGEAASQHLKKHWVPVSIRPDVSDIPVIVELAKQKLLPTEIRDELYQEPDCWIDNVSFILVFRCR
jgi:hypothetical protein